MHFDQDIEAELLASQVIVIDELRAVQGGHDEQYRICKIRPRLIELELVYHELLVQDGERNRFPNRFENVETAVKEVLIRQNRKRRGAVLLINSGDGERIKLLAKHPFARGNLFDFGNQSRSGVSGEGRRAARADWGWCLQPGQRRIKPHRSRRLPDPGLEVRQIGRLLLLLDLLLLMFENPIENHRVTDWCT